MDDKTLIQHPVEPDPQPESVPDADKTLLQTPIKPEMLEQAVSPAPEPAVQSFGDQNNDNVPDFITESPIPPEPPKKTNWTAILLVSGGVFFLLCICCIAGLAIYLIFNDTNSSSSPMPTAVLGVETPTRESATEIMPTNSEIPAWTGTFFDAFNSNTNNWTEGDITNDYCTVTYTIDGVYGWDVTALQGVNQKSWAENSPTVSDFIITVDAAHTSGAENAAYGIVFRATDSENLYYFAVSDVGYYYVGLLENNEWTTLVDWTEYQINPGESNRLAVLGEGDKFTFYINDEEVDSLRESTFPEGFGGLAIELYEVGDTSTFEFDNFKVEVP